MRCEVHSIPQPALCQACARDAAHKKTRLRALIVIIGAALVTTGIVVFLSTRPKKVVPPPKPEGDVLEKYKRERLAAAPCDETANIDLVEYLQINRRWQDALDVALKSLGCGVLADMKERILYCRQQLRQWPEAAALIEEMIAEHPRDRDLWWWHGDTWRYRDQNELAMMDFRQSLANAFWHRGTIAVRLFMYAAEPAKAPCEAYRAWRYYERVLDGSINDEARNLVAALDREKTCVPERGTGSGTLVVGKRYKAMVGKATAELMVDPRAGTTIISRELAERAGLVPTSTGQTATLWSEVRITGQPARAPSLKIGKLAATNVDVAISDDLATGDDGVVGLSFFWHFDSERSYDQDSVTLTPPR